MKKHVGFTLIEVLIAVIVLATGLLGFAGLQATSLKNNQSAFNRSQATQLAYDLADRIRANSAAIATYTSIDPEDATEQADCLTTTGCSKEEMAEHDLFEWNQVITNTLPGGAGTLTVTSGVYTISLTWDDDHDGDNNNNPNFQTSFQL
ncbi:type IV pilus modification protein PilV [Methylicorpusculum oleiharenae]|uniref:type IV pilus modification protein PilV n=1 Tax=Methylicorpusculum oleiharenae TaxID=1338687 RepID=UPI0013581F06|nr:type IV pilus modification protein PilV [Methylicorpusculum oleiharenae]MCD2449272.1 type IV pilus modification protein PilV [Methylicorpusculum oleiharenae]